MGGGGSQTINQTFNMDVLNEMIYESITTHQSTLSASLNNIQKMEVNLGDMGPKCDVDLTQDINAKSQSSMTMEPQTINASKAKVESELTAQAAAAMEKVTEAGNMQFGDKQDMNQQVNMEIKNIVKNTFETNNLSEVISEVINLQEGKLNIKRCNGKLNFKQNIVAELMAEAITKSITSSVAESDVLNKLAASTEGSQKTENKGIADIVGTFFDGLAGPMKYAIIASVVCVCLIVVLVAVMALSPAGQKSMTNMSGAAASRLGGRRRMF